MSKQNPIYALVGGGVQTIHRSDDFAELRRKADLHSTIFKRRYAVMRGDETVYETERAKVDARGNGAIEDLDERAGAGERDCGALGPLFHQREE